MDILTPLGVFLGFGGILFGNHIEGGHIAALLNLPAFIIVFFGTVGAVLIETPLSVMRHSVKVLPWIFMPPDVDTQGGIARIIEWANIARKEGLLGLEKLIEGIADPFEQKSVQMLVDGSDAHAIESILFLEMESLEKKNGLVCKVFESFGGYCPTVGIIGAVLGLIHVMNNLSDPTKLGGGIAAAFVATIYGVGLANLIFLPMGNKIKKNTDFLLRHREMIVAGVCAIAGGENPRTIEAKLQGFL
jgi:chemotaxis protein MotA